jgi:ATP-dependent protease HslVU (ClpYQ) peptidase subunit
LWEISTWRLLTITAICALRLKIDNKIEVVWGCDSRITRGNEICYANNNHKFVEFDNFTVLFCGSAAIQHILDEFNRKTSLKKRKFMAMKNINHVFEFTELATKMLDTKIDALGGSDEGGEFSLIIVTVHGLYLLDKWAFVEESSVMMTSGSGSPYMDGFIKGSLENIKTLDDMKEVVLKSLQVAVDLNTTCGAPLHVKELKRIKNRGG